MIPTIASAREPTMPFGRFRDKPLSELPNEYLVRLAKLDKVRDPLWSRVVAELCRRLLAAARRAPTPEAPGAEIHLGDVDQDGERPPF